MPAARPIARQRINGAWPRDGACDLGAYELVNVSRDTATTTVPGTPITDSAISRNDPNWYRIDVPVAGSTITATMTSTVDYDIFLFAPRVDKESGQLRDLGKIVDLGQLGDIGQLDNIGQIGQHRPARQHLKSIRLGSIG